MALDTRLTTSTTRQLTGRIGAEVRGIELRHADEGQIDELRAAAVAHRVVFVRSQDLSAQD